MVEEIKEGFQREPIRGEGRERKKGRERGKGEGTLLENEVFILTKKKAIQAFLSQPVQAVTLCTG
jgi:hypothetical protein